MATSDGNAVAAEIRAEIAATTAELSSKYNKQPGLAVVLLVIDQCAKYVSMKKKAAKVGIASFETLLPEDVDEETLVKQVSELMRTQTLMVSWCSYRTDHITKGCMH